MANKTAGHKPSTRSGFHSRAFQDGIETLEDELRLAFQWQRPSILIAVHGSKNVQAKAQNVLEKDLIKEGKKIERLLPTHKNPNLIRTICEFPGQGNIVFFVMGIENETPESTRQTYQALNLHREKLVEQHVHAVFWLTKNEAAQLPYLAPDFWAFRHRVVEFVTRGSTKKTAP